VRNNAKENVGGVHSGKGRVDGMGKRNRVLEFSQMNSHGVVAAESFAAVGAFPCAVGESVLYALVAEHVPASLDDRVLELTLADLALNQQLHSRRL
jgi:hypothetical protein